jgi:signal transduction histidine kinase
MSVNFGGCVSSMFYVLSCIFQQHDLRLVILAGAMCLFACGTALAMVSRANQGSRRAQFGWLATAGAVAGCGIWATHFIAMLAYTPGLPIGYDLDVTILSALVAILFCGLGFAVSFSRFGGMLGGAVAGAAICMMHYIGMAAVRAPADLVWNSQYVAASLLVGVALTALAMHLAIRRKDFIGYGGAAALFAFAIVAMHFTGMTAVVLRPDPLIAMSDALLNPAELAVLVAMGAGFIVALGLIGALVDHHLAGRTRGEALRLRTYIAELESTKHALEKTGRDLSTALAAAAEASQAKSAFLAAMSHELRTPLNAVIGFSETMALEVFGPLGSPRYRDYAKDIRASGSHLLSLINDVLDLSRLDAGQTELHEEDFALQAVIAETLRMVKGQAVAARVALTTDLPEDLPLVHADMRRIKQVILNLVSNALKFTPGNGRVTVRAQRLAEGIAVAVADTGIGIAPQDIPKAMERFGQVDSGMARKHDGTGLGLPLSKQFMELHGGDLVLESTLHVGTVVTITLPESRVVPAGKHIAAA